MVKGLVCVVFILGMCSAGFGVEAEIEIEFVHPRDYFETLVREIRNAKRSISISLYQFPINLQHSNSLPLRIAEALVHAKEQGVKVEVILDQNIDFNENPYKEMEVMEGKNWVAYEFLKVNGLEVYFDSPNIYLHSKVVVFDSESILIGSSNWSQSSFTRNIEANVLIRSQEMAKKVLESIAAIERQTISERGRESVPVPVSFLENGNFLGNMVTTQDRGGFDLYGFLLKCAYEKGTSEFDLDFDEAASALGIKGWLRTDHRRKLTRILKRLQDRYHLIYFEKQYSKSARVRLNDLANPQVILNLDQGERVMVPLDYWRLGWNRKLELPGEVFYLLSLYYSAHSPMKPRWSLAGEIIAKEFHLTLDYVRSGVTELRRANLLEVNYDDLPIDGAGRRANIYATNTLYDPVELENGLQALKKKGGLWKFKRALKCATLVYKENDLGVVEKFIFLENKYGRKKVEMAYMILAAKHPDNPKRSAGYFFNTVIGIATTRKT